MESRRRLQDWHHMLAMCSIMAVVSGGLAYLFLHIDLIPNVASVERGLIDSFIQLLFAIASVFFAVIVTVFAYALLFFRRQRGDAGFAGTHREAPLFRRKPRCRKRRVSLLAFCRLYLGSGIYHDFYHQVTIEEDYGNGDGIGCGDKTAECLS
jgi:hypothetical protein